MRGASCGIRYVPGKDAIGNSCCLPIARIVWRSWRKAAISKAAAKRAGRAAVNRAGTKARKTADGAV
jgi:hypothetical protein